MRSSRKQVAVSLLAACLAVVPLAGCGKKGEVKAGGGTTTASAGGEQPAAGTGSGDEAKPEGGGAKADAGGAKPGKPAAGGTASAGAPAAGGGASRPTANPWGSPEADSGRPLPPRKRVSGKAKSSFDAGVKAARAGNLGEAKKSFDEALKADSSSYEVLYAIGVVADREGKESQALDFYRRSLRTQPDYEKAAAGIVAIYLRQGQPEKARQFLEPLAKQWERNLHLTALYADLLVTMGQVDPAIDQARAALRRDERFVPAMISLVRANLRAGRLELADSILDQALTVDDKNAELHYLKGKRLLDDQRLAEALAEFRKAVELDPDFAEARMELGTRLLAGANYNEALAQFQAVEKISPKLVEVHLALGDAYRSTKQWDKAKTSLDRALRMKTDLPQAHFELALMYMSAGAEFPGMDLLTALARAKEEFGTYRSMMGGRLTRDDASTAYLDDIDKAVAREQKRIEREKKAAERAAKKPADAAAKPADAAAKPADAAAKPADAAAQPAAPAAAKPADTKGTAK
jgi:tetratricopeptide (TPR) repeat protein